MEFSDLIKSGVIKDRSDTEFISIDKVLNRRINIYNFEFDIETKFGKRTVIYFNFENENQKYRLYTNSSILKNILTQLDKLKHLPLSTTISKEKGKCDYYKFT